uniref:Putative 8-amino-7-oxononanoate synthase n=1 Tax=Bacillus subtilis subsp. natto TaxID=86029 RepID=BIOF_BACNA|nr:RecName: Full=Putative 8-amino-7-oxononanoate synthase; Short=AONS; AltName: Full=7-keto-8-amino-pelargonic acid synthase; Short=7-KAP synthase; AltName: Full=8-amino-7-ketopelargonate synthase [Bacillus subtilis subsp. natto]BAC03241.1 8-amino-7-oxononanoate synthase [Bacillus subtilis]
MKIDSWLNDRLDIAKEAGVHRNLRSMNGAPVPERNIDGENQTVWSSNNYLGLASDRRLIDAAQTALQQFGTGSSGSRLTTGNSVWHEKLEKKIASFKRTEAALLFSSGYLANVGVLSSLPEKEDVILSDQLNHASIIDGCRLSKADTVVYRHIDMNDLENKLNETQRYQRRFIVTDGVFSMDGTIVPLDQIISLAKRYHAFVVVDDAHATGVLGDSGRGTSEYFGVYPDIVIGTLSKAVGTEGGFAAGSAVFIDFLLNHARTFIFQTAIPPASCAAAHEAFNIRTSLKNMGYVVKGDHTPIIPVVIGDAHKTVIFAEKLQGKGIYAPAIRPPTVAPGESRIRITITSDHSMGDIDDLLKTFHSIGKELHII